MREPGIYLVNGVEEVVFPEVFPEPTEVERLINEALERIVSNNVLLPIRTCIVDAIGSMCIDGIMDSVMYLPIKADTIRNLLFGRIPIQQLIGHILRNEDVLPSMFPDINNCLINHNSSKNTYVVHRVCSDDLYIRHIMKDSTLLRRYLKNTNVEISSVRDGIVALSVPLVYDNATADGLVSAIHQLPAMLDIYYKLLTRFESCKDYTSDFPKFENS